jgi:hypothetical protein
VNARDNQVATFANKTQEFARLAAIDRAFLTVVKDWINPASEVAAMLFLRSHSAYRAATMLACAGQAVECYAVNRTALEFAGYAIHIHRNPADAMIWLDRRKNSAALKAARRGFSHDKILASAKSANLHAAQRFESLYQQTIDFGAHPNELSVTGHIAMVEEDDRRVMNSIYLHSDDTGLAMAMKTTARCGVCSLELLQCVFNARFELMGVNAMMPHLKQGL